MEQEVRSSDILTMLANIMDSHPHGIQNSQSNNNNSNPVSTLGSSTLAPNTLNSTLSNMSEGTQIAISTTQTPNASMNVQMLDIASQPPPVPNSSDAEMAELESISSTFMSPNFPASTTSGSAGGETLIYDGSSHVTMPDEVGNNIDYPRNSLDFGMTSNQVLLEALSSMDKDNFSEGQSNGPNAQSGLRTETTNSQSVSLAQSFVSLLSNHTQVDPCNAMWPINTMQNNFNKTRSDASSSVQIIPTLINEHSNIFAQTANGMEMATPAIQSQHSMYSNAMSCKVAKHHQHPDKVAGGNTHYTQNDLMRYGQENYKSGNNSVLGMEKGGSNVDVAVPEDRSKEKRLTTTPIPSDADKSSSCCSSSSSGSVSGPEQSPDHVTEQTGSVRRQQNSDNNYNDTIAKTHRLGNGVMQHTTGNNIKGYPCLSDVSTINLGTINFTSVMDNSTRAIPDIHNDSRKNNISSPSDINVQPLPTSDSIVEIDETLPSPPENIPVSPCTPTAEHSELLPTAKQVNPVNIPHVNNMSARSYARLQMMNQTSALSNQADTSNKVTVQYSDDMVPKGNSSMKKFENSRRSVTGQKDHKARDFNNNHSAPLKYKNKTGTDMVYDGKSNSKQKKQRNSKQHRQKNLDIQQTEKPRKEGEYVPHRFDSRNVVIPGQVGQPGLIPKVNADPTIKSIHSCNKRQDISNIRNTLATSQSFHRSSLPANPGFNPMSTALPSQQLSHSNQNMLVGRHVSNHTTSAMPKPAPVSTTPSTTVRQWQTVTAVQVPKMPPMLSEQDRIPKRGRPSKKMMQQNLKVKKDANQQHPNNPTTLSSTSGSFQMTNSAANAAPSEIISNQNKLVSMYTINDKGLVEEIAPKPKENRRSKERTQAFLKMLDDIKSSKQQVNAKPKFGEKAKSGPEKPVKKRSKPRAKVFGRGVSQPLTETGITETMFTFSALAHQYKISNSIVSRATENLLKSVAMKRSKEQSLTNNSSADGDKHLSGMNTNKKGVSVSHCDVKNSTSSKVMVPSTQLLPTDPSRPSQGVSTMSAAQTRLLHATSSQPVPSSVAETAILERKQSKEVPQASNAGKLESQLPNVIKTQATPNVSQGEILQLAKPHDNSSTSSKSKQRKKKHKKHKKHKYAENKLSSGKKKKKDKEKKKKSKKKVKAKIGPSASVSIVKPPYQDKMNLSAVPNSETNTAEKPRVSHSENSFNSGFRQSSDHDEAALWPTEDNIYEEDDSSSDETSSTAPVPYTQSTSNKTDPPTSKASMSSFAQYSNSTLDFGMFSNQKPKLTSEPTNQSTQKPSKETEVLNQGSSFSASTSLRPKKHHKHKKKKFPRKSKNSCDPKLLAALDKIVIKLKDLKLESTLVVNRSLSSQTSNIFFATSVSDSPQPSLWRVSNASSFSSSKSDTQQAGIVKDTAFKRDNSRTSRKSQSNLNHFVPNTKHTSVSTPNINAYHFTNANTLSVFCSSPFFQKYGYVSKVAQVSSTAVATVLTCRPSIIPSSTGHAATQPRSAPCISTNVLLESPSISEKVQEAVAVSQSRDSAQVLKLEKRKRGWPRGKPRGPRTKKGRLGYTDPVTTQDGSHHNDDNPVSSSMTDGPVKQKASTPVASHLNRPAGHGNSKREINGGQAQNERDNVAKASRAVDTNSEKDSGSSSAESSRINRTEAREKNVTFDPVENSSADNEDLGNIVSETLLKQIKQAIAASLPAHPSVNKDEINKSVDAALQNFMENMNKTQASAANTSDAAMIDEEAGNTKKVAKKCMRRRSSDKETAMQTNSTPGSLTKADKHPKKVWACKHQDTETVPHTPCLSKGQSATYAFNSSSSKKRGPGRPRKDAALSTAQKHSLIDTNQSLRLGKVPTVSATVMPLKRRPGTLASRAAMNSSKAIKRPTGRTPTHFTSEERNTVGSSSPEHNATISRDKAIKSTDAVCSSKSLQSKMRSGHYRDIPDPSVYDGTSIGEHLMEAIDVTVDKYSWDNYKKFEEACLAVEREMNCSGENDGLADRRKLSGPKKSIELVIEKLKSKQAQTIHSAATALLQLHDTQSQLSVTEEHLENELDAISPQGSGFVQKRPRGRPRKHPISDDTLELPPKHPKLSLSEPKPLSKKHRILSKETKGKAKSRDDNVSPVNKKNDVSPTLARKSYLNAGLYSSTFKQEERSDIEKEDDGSDTEEDALLPPPIDAGLHVRCLQKEFQLPYDIWWMYKHKKITASQNPSLQYVKINENVYVSPRPALNLGEHICTCKPPQEGSSGCGRQCLNRLMYIECSATSCPCGDSCTNQVIQKSEWCQSLKRIKTPDRGWGICSTQVIPEGSFILEYVGEVLSEAEFRTRTVELYHAYNDHYCVQLDSQTVIDGYRLANEGRYVNHSCEPNCEMLKWCVNGEYRICLFARHEIKPNEELTYDYNFHAYNMDQQQECRCGSKNCRGFIGGKAQRSTNGTTEVAGNMGNASISKYGKTNSRNATSNKGRGNNNQEEKKKSNKEEEMGIKEFSILQMKPLTSREQDFIRLRQLFLIRNLAQVRKKEEQQQKAMAKRSGCSSLVRSGSKSKSKKTQNKEECEKLDNALIEMYNAIATCKDQNGVSVAIPFMNLPSKKKNPEYYERICDPIDLSVIEHNLVDKQYQDIESFHSDVQRVFKNAEKYHGRKSTLGKDVARLRKAYANARGSVMLHLNGHKKQGKGSNTSDKDPDENNENIHRKNEDYIRCICCIYKDEGLMVQCEKCYVWQHCDCMGVKPGSMDRYLCEECDPRPVSKEVRVIPPPPNSPPGHTYYVTLLRDKLLIKQGDCAYLMRDHRLRNNSNMPSMRVNRNLASIPQDELNIFRIEKLWTDERGDKYAYGHHFLRPHETHHAPSRTFYHNELFASPFYEIIPLEAIVGLCMVMDLYTYCKGKPKDFKMSDIFICDFRVDKAASLFTRITKKRYPICTKPHVFDAYKIKICPKKNFQPHQVPEHYKKSSGRPSAQSAGFPGAEKLADLTDDENAENGTDDRFQETEEGEESNSIAGENRSGRWKKRQRLNGIAHKLLSKLPKQAVDVSYLLEPGSGKRQRKKTLLSLESLSQQK